jgi:hypothetical protein
MNHLYHQRGGVSAAISKLAAECSAGCGFFGWWRASPARHHLVVKALASVQCIAAGDTLR